MSEGAAPVDSGQLSLSPEPSGRTVRIWIDGGSRGNPGPSAIGVLVEDTSGMAVATISRAIGVTTNNVAEYRALLAGLEKAQEIGAAEVEVVSDSELLVKQMRGEYKVKSEGLKPLHAEARQRAAGFPRFTIRHTMREHNAKADGLVNRALDEQQAAGL
jgi:ribonuclease HI